MELGNVGSIASIAGLLAAITIAIYQRIEMQKARRVAAAERERAATLENHLARQRWLQLRSLGEQIDSIEIEGGYRRDPLKAAMRARLREQYVGLLGVVATSTQGFSASSVRHWVSTGRLPRPWQVAEAITHLDEHSSADAAPEDRAWLEEILESQNYVPRVENPPVPRELNSYTGAFILVASAVREELVKLDGRNLDLRVASIFLHLLAEDVLTASETIVVGRPVFKSWEWGTNKSFRQRFEHYKEQDSWTIIVASDWVQQQLLGYEQHFLPLHFGFFVKLVPTADAANSAREIFPQIADLVRSLDLPTGKSGPTKQS